MEKEIKIAIFGDSISEGIGSRKANYSKELEKIFFSENKKIKIYNYAFTGTMIDYTKKIKEKYEREKFDVVIVGYGNVDGMLRPNTKTKNNLYKHLPKRYKKNGMLNPRPYYSKNKWKKIFQKLDSLIRWNLNKILLKVQGSTTWITLDKFYKEYLEFCTFILNKTDKIILLSTVKVGEKYFPGTNNSYIKFNEKIKKIEQLNSKIEYLDLYNTLNEKELFFDDLFHPNQQGYEFIAKLIYNKIAERTKDE